MWKSKVKCFICALFICFASGWITSNGVVFSQSQQTRGGEMIVETCNLELHVIEFYPDLIKDYSDYQPAVDRAETLLMRRRSNEDALQSIDGEASTSEPFVQPD